MFVFRTVLELREWRRQLLLEGKSVGLVPTMGALHAGHISLVEQANKENDAVVISIFVNPAQFAPHEDFDAYPRTWDADRQIIQNLDLPIVAVFMPTKQEMYPGTISLNVTEQKGAFVEVLGLSEQLEGVSRPHFFRGVATIVSKLFNIVQPERAYFGQKDIQQTIVLKALVRDLHFPIDLRVVPSVREPDGLAMSSRNAYLSPDQREDALILWRSLKAGMDFYHAKRDASPVNILRISEEQIKNNIDTAEGRVTLDYLEIVHPESLRVLTDGDKADGAILVGAIFVHGDKRTIRLIDNVIIR